MTAVASESYLQQAKLLALPVAGIVGTAALLTIEEYLLAAALVVYVLVASVILVAEAKATVGEGNNA